MTNETSWSLAAKHMACLKELLIEAIALLKGHKEMRTEQNEKNASYCGKRIPEDGLIDWKDSADFVWTLIRAVSKPYPGAFTFCRDEKVVIWEADYIGDAPYWGIPGQIQEFSHSGAIVTCGDGKHILVRLVETANSGPVKPQDRFKKHDRLGINILNLVKK